MEGLAVGLGERCLGLVGRGVENGQSAHNLLDDSWHVVAIGGGVEGCERRTRHVELFADLLGAEKPDRQGLPFAWHSLTEIETVTGSPGLGVVGVGHHSTTLFRDGVEGLDYTEGTQQHIDTGVVTQIADEKSPGGFCQQKH